MKKFFIIVVALVLLTLTGCNFGYEEGDILYKRFVVIESKDSDDGTMLTVYDKETNVEYFMCYSLYKGFMSPIYNADGTLKIYDDSKENE